MDYELYEPKCVLLTGIAGFIGSNVAVYFVRKYPHINFIGLDCISYCSDVNNFIEINTAPNWKFYRCDLLDPDNLDQIFRENQIDTIVHYAAFSHVDASFMNAIEFTRNNVLGTHFLLEHAKKYKIQRFIHVSTDEVYGSKDAISTEDSTLDPTNPYAATKTCAEYLVKSYYHSFKLPIIISRGNNVYGPKQFPEKIIPKFILRLLSGRKCQIQGSGNQKRSFMHVDDVATAFETLLFRGKIGEIYNIGSTKEYMVLEVAERLIKILKPGEDINSWIEFIEDRNFNDHRYFISSQKLINLGWNQQIDFDTGLQMTLDWYQNHQNQWSI